MPRRQTPLHKPPLLGYYVMASRAAAPAWTPASISGLKLWIDFSDSDTLFTDAGSTKVATDGDAIYQANDKSGNNYHFVQTDNGKRPTYKVNIQNSLSAASFDGGDSMKGTGLSLSTTVTGLFAVYNINKFYGQILSNRTADTPIQYQAYISDGYPGTFIRDAAGDSLSVDLAWPYRYTNSNVVYTLVRNSTGVLLYINGIQRKTGSNANLDGVTANDTYIGSIYTGASQFFQGYMYELIVYDRVLTDEERGLVDTYINDKWSIYEPAKAQSLAGMLSFEPEEEKLWWQGADVVAQAQPQVELTWWDKAKAKVKVFLGEVKQAIMDYINEKA